MPLYKSTAIANRFVQKALDEGIAATQMKLQKLCFLANGWNWVVNEQQLIAESPEAWRYGPVYPDLYEHSKLFGSLSIDRLITPDDSDRLYFFDVLNSRSKPFDAELSGREEEVLDQVWNRYKKLSAFKLSDLTHKAGTPWFNTYHQYGDRSLISQELIHQHYQQIVEHAAAR